MTCSTVNEPDDDLFTSIDLHNPLLSNCHSHIHQMYSCRNLQESVSNLQPSNGSLSMDSLDIVNPQPSTPRYPSYPCRPLDRYGPPLNFFSYFYNTSLYINSYVEPKSYKDAILDQK